MGNITNTIGARCGDCDYWICKEHGDQAKCKVHRINIERDTVCNDFTNDKQISVALKKENDLKLNIGFRKAKKGKKSL